MERRSVASRRFNCVPDKLDDAVATTRRQRAVAPASADPWSRWVEILAKRAERFVAEGRRTDAALCLEAVTALGERFGGGGARFEELRREVGDPEWSSGGTRAPRATWKFLDDGKDQGKGWALVEFDDSVWREGPRTAWIRRRCKDPGELGGGSATEAPHNLLPGRVPPRETRENELAGALASP